jgi:hypothetical protein
MEIAFWSDVLRAVRPEEPTDVPEKVTPEFAQE